ncbi:MAG: glycosyltransferase family 39 protein [bacterium]|nr:glycosyltransferase family 39 protein [bacterium]
MARRHRIHRTIEGKRRYENRARLIVSLSLLVIFLLLPISLYNARFGGILESGEAMDAAQVARNLARGGGMVTNVIRPHLHGRLPSFVTPPDLLHAPLHIWLLSRMPGITRGSLFDPPDGSVIHLSVFFFVATALILFFMARAVFDVQTALVAAAAYLFCVPLLDAAVSGTRDTLLGAVLTIFFALAYMDRNESFSFSFLFGVVLGACYLASYECLILLLPFVAFKIARGGELAGRHLAAGLVGFAVTAAPWVLRTIMKGGNPLFGVPYAAAMRGPPFGTPPLEGGFWRCLWLKMLSLYDNLIHNMGVVPAIGFFLLVPVVWFENSHMRYLSRFFITCGLLLVVVSLAGQGSVGVVYGCLPVAIFMGTVVFMGILPSRSAGAEQARVRMITAYVLISILPFIITMVGRPPAVWLQPRRALRLRTLSDVRGMMHAGDIVMTNVPEMLAYYGEFSTLPLPADSAEFRRWQRGMGMLRHAFIAPGGGQAKWERMVLRQKMIPTWFLSERAYVYPRGEHFITADGGHVTAPPSP